MSSFDEKYGINRTFGEEDYEYYEDTHDENGQYIQRLRELTIASNNVSYEGREDTFTPRANNIVNNEPIIEQEIEQKKEKEISFKNVIVYEPTVEKQAQEVIDCIKSGEPIIIKLDETDEEVAQRVLDFTAGAVYALGGVIKKVSNCAFLAVPPSVKVIIEGENDG